MATYDGPQSLGYFRDVFNFMRVSTSYNLTALEKLNGKLEIAKEQNYFGIYFDTLYAPELIAVFSQENATESVISFQIFLDKATLKATREASEAPQLPLFQKTDRYLKAWFMIVENPQNEKSLNKLLNQQLGGDTFQNLWKKTKSVGSYDHSKPDPTTVNSDLTIRDAIKEIALKIQQAYIIADAKLVDSYEANYADINVVSDVELELAKEAQKKAKSQLEAIRSIVYSYGETLEETPILPQQILAPQEPVFIDLTEIPTPPESPIPPPESPIRILETPPLRRPMSPIRTPIGRPVTPVISPTRRPTPATPIGRPPVITPIRRIESPAIRTESPPRIVEPPMPPLEPTVIRVPAKRPEPMIATTVRTKRTADEAAAEEPVKKKSRKKMLKIVSRTEQKVFVPMEIEELNQEFISIGSLAVNDKNIAKLMIAKGSNLLTYKGIVTTDYKAQTTTEGSGDIYQIQLPYRAFNREIETKANLQTEISTSYKAMIDDIKNQVRTYLGQYGDETTASIQCPDRFNNIKATFFERDIQKTVSKTPNLQLLQRLFTELVPIQYQNISAVLDADELRTYLNKFKINYSVFIDTLWRYLIPILNNNMQLRTVENLIDESKDFYNLFVKFEENEGLFIGNVTEALRKYCILRYSIIDMMSILSDRLSSTMTAINESINIVINMINQLLNSTTFTISDWYENVEIDIAANLTELRNMTCGAVSLMMAIDFQQTEAFSEIIEAYNFLKGDMRLRFNTFVNFIKKNSQITDAVFIENIWTFTFLKRIYSVLAVNAKLPDNLLVKYLNIDKESVSTISYPPVVNVEVLLEILPEVEEDALANIAHLHKLNTTLIGFLISDVIIVEGVLPDLNAKVIDIKPKPPYDKSATGFYGWRPTGVRTEPSIPGIYEQVSVELIKKKEVPVTIRDEEPVRRPPEEPARQPKIVILEQQILQPFQQLQQPEEQEKQRLLQQQQQEQEERERQRLLQQQQEQEERERQRLLQQQQEQEERERQRLLQQQQEQIEEEEEQERLEQEKRRILQEIQEQVQRQKKEQEENQKRLDEEKQKVLQNELAMLEEQRKLNEQQQQELRAEKLKLDESHKRELAERQQILEQERYRLSEAMQVELAERKRILDEQHQLEQQKRQRILKAEQELINNQKIINEQKQKDLLEQQRLFNESQQRATIERQEKEKELREQEHQQRILRDNQQQLLNQVEHLQKKIIEQEKVLSQQIKQQQAISEQRSKDETLTSSLLDQTQRQRLQQQLELQEQLKEQIAKQQETLDRQILEQEQLKKQVLTSVEQAELQEQIRKQEQLKRQLYEENQQILIEQRALAQNQEMLLQQQLLPEVPQDRFIGGSFGAGGGGPGPFGGGGGGGGPGPFGGGGGGGGPGPFGGGGGSGFGGGRRPIAETVMLEQAIDIQEYPRILNENLNRISVVFQRYSAELREKIETLNVTMTNPQLSKFQMHRFIREGVALEKEYNAFQKASANGFQVIQSVASEIIEDIGELKSLIDIEPINSLQEISVNDVLTTLNQRVRNEKKEKKLKADINNGLIEHNVFLQSLSNGVINLDRNNKEKVFLFGWKKQGVETLLKVPDFAINLLNLNEAFAPNLQGFISISQFIPAPTQQPPMPGPVPGPSGL